MRPALSDQASIFGIQNDKLSGGPIERLYNTIDTTFRPSPEAKVKAAIVCVDIVGAIASERVDSNEIAHLRFNDFCNLLKVHGNCSVANKTYHRHSKV